MESEYVLEWLRLADSDLASAEYLRGMFPVPLEIICYHAQQSSEKYLKGYLIYKGILEPPKTHDLDDLCVICSEYNKDFWNIKRACAALTRYGVQPRYPNEMEITERDMQRALEYARLIRDFEPLEQIRQEISQMD